MAVDFFRCSDCGKRWWDVVTIIPKIKTCHECGAIFNHDETEYFEVKAKPVSSSILPHSLTYDELESKLIQLTGYDIENLVELFAAGYALQPPKYTSFEDLEKECE